jgi:threonine dehydrogenase-like Zn-dependent dehydrogenase
VRGCAAQLVSDVPGDRERYVRVTAKETHEFVPADHPGEDGSGGGDGRQARAAIECGKLAAEVLRLTGGTGVDLVLEATPGATLGASLAAAKRVTGRVIVYGVAGGEAAVTNFELMYKHQFHIIGLNIGVLIQAGRACSGSTVPVSAAQ